MAEGLRLDASIPCPAKKIHLPCCMCKQYVKAIPWIAGRYYGLLENCLHPFCLFCIRGYSNSRLNHYIEEKYNDPTWPHILCPVCGRPSSSIVASRDLPTDAKQKLLKFQAFREKMSNMPCPFQKEGLGECFCNDKGHKFICTTYLEKGTVVGPPS